MQRFPDEMMAEQPAVNNARFCNGLTRQRGPTIGSGSTAEAASVACANVAFVSVLCAWRRVPGRLFIFAYLREWIVLSAYRERTINKVSIRPGAQDRIDLRLATGPELCR